jgi:hypothetical protein
MHLPLRFLFKKHKNVAEQPGVQIPAGAGGFDLLPTVQT